jgi:glycosidase
MRQVIFLDNHDIARFYSVVGEDTAKYKMSLAWLLTCRGIPQLYYGGEVLMTGFTSPNDGYVRQDFPGGWAGDSLSKFTAAGRTVKENAVFDYIKRLANFRKTSSALKTGKMMQYLPVDGVYVYFRYTNNQRVMCIMNTNEKVVTLDLKRFEEMTRSYSGALDVANGTVSPLGTSVTLSPYSNLVLELRK